MGGAVTGGASAGGIALEATANDVVATGVVAGTVDWAAGVETAGRRGSHRGGRRRWRDCRRRRHVVVVVVVDVVVDVDVVVVVAAASRGSCTGSIGDGEAGTVATRARPIIAAARTAPSDAITRRAGLRRTAGQYGERRRQFGELGVRVLSSPSTEASA